METTLLAIHQAITTREISRERMMVEFRWINKSGKPEQGWIKVGEPGQNLWQVLQFREMQNPEEIGLQPPIWSEWGDIEHWGYQSD